MPKTAHQSRIGFGFAVFALVSVGLGVTGAALRDAVLIYSAAGAGVLAIAARVASSAIASKAKREETQQEFEFVGSAPARGSRRTPVHA